MDFKYIRKLKPFIILSMILIFMPVITRAGGLIPTDFNGFAITNDDIVVVGDNTAVTGWKNNEKVFSFTLAFKGDYALSVNQNNNIVIYTKNAMFVFAQDGTPLTLSESNGETFEKLKNRKVITTSNGASYVLTNKLGFINSIIKIENSEQTTVYRTPSAVLLAEFAFWEGNALLVICLIAGLLDVRKRRFLKTSENYNEAVKATKKEALPKFLKAFSKPELQQKGAAFSSEYSTKPGEAPRQKIVESEKTTNLSIDESIKTEDIINEEKETTEAP